MDILGVSLEWRNRDERVPIDGLDVNGNAAIHLAAHHNLLPCVDLLVNYGAQLDLINHQNLSCVEMADIAEHVDLGTMIELAWLYLAADPRVENTPQYHKLSHDLQNTRLILNSHSLSDVNLMDFIDQAVNFIAQTTGETHTRAEVLLAMYRWDVARLKAEYLDDNERVLSDARLISSSALAQRPAERPLTASELRAREQPFGIGIEDVFLDGCFASSGPFTVLRDGIASQYTVSDVDGKTKVTAEKDPLTALNSHVSPLSHCNPQATASCVACNSPMFEQCDLQHFLSDEVVEAMRREVDCGSGHKFCLNCWAVHCQRHVLREDFGVNMGCLPCLDPQCGEVLDLQWAPLLLGDQGLIDRLHGERQRFIVDSIGLRWCPDPECGLLVHMSASNYNAQADANLPQSVVCANGHAFCLSCEREAHTPCSCANLDLWMEAIREEAGNANDRDPSNPSNVLLGLPTIKMCPACEAADVEKIDGCSKMNCGQCHAEFCWTCLQAWSLHCEGQQCNRLVSPSQGGPKEVWVEEKGDDFRALSRNSKGQRRAQFLHHFVRFQSHSESMQLEARVMMESVSRVSHALQTSLTGEFRWLLGDHVPNPLTERDDEDSEVKEIAISEFHLPKQPSAEFLIDAFEELEKCRTFLKWSYPYALFEFSEHFQHTQSSSSNSVKNEENKAHFEFLQAQLEINTEFLSDMIARRRLRGTRVQIVLCTRQVKSCRIELEDLLLTRISVPLPFVEDDPSLHAQDRGGEGMHPVSSNVVSWNTHQQQQVQHKEETLTSASRISASNRSISPTNSGRHQRPDISEFMRPANFDDDDTEVDEQAGHHSQQQYQQQHQSSHQHHQQQQSSSFITTQTTTHTTTSHSQQQQQSENHSIHDQRSGRREVTINTEFEEEEVQQQKPEIFVNVQPLVLSPHHNTSSQLTPTSFKAAFDAARMSQRSTYSSESGPRVDVELTFDEAVAVEKMMSGGYSMQESVRAHFMTINKTFNRNATYNFPAPEPEAVVELTESRLNEHRLSTSRYSGEYQTSPVNSQQQQSQQQRDHFHFAHHEHRHEVSVEQRLIAAKKDPDQEALEHAILLSCQESEFGVNMYDALTPNDEPVIDEYIAQGFTREEAILIIFEEKYGQIAAQKVSTVTPAMPTVYHIEHVEGLQEQQLSAEDELEVARLMTVGYTREQAVDKMTREAVAQAQNQARSIHGNSVHGNNTVSSLGTGSAYPPHQQHSLAMSLNEEVAEEEDDGDLTDAEAQVVDDLMQSGQFTSLSLAIDHVLGQRKPKRGRLPSASQSVAQGGGMSLEEEAIALLMQQGYSLEQAQNEYRHRMNGFNVSNNNLTLDPDQLAIEELVGRGYSLDQATQMHYQQKEYSDALAAPLEYVPMDSRSLGGGGSVGGGRSVGGNSNHFPSEYGFQQQESFPVLYPPQPQGTESRRPSHNSSNLMGSRRPSFHEGQDGLIIDGAYQEIPPPYGDYHNSSQMNMNSMHGGASVSSHHLMLPPVPPSLPQSRRAGGDDQAVEIAMIISEQEASYGINMYDSLTPADQPEIDAMVARGIDTDVAIRMVFDRRYRNQGRSNNDSTSLTGVSYPGPPVVHDSISRGPSFYAPPIVDPRYMMDSSPRGGDGSVYTDYNTPRGGGGSVYGEDRGMRSGGSVHGGGGGGGGGRSVGGSIHMDDRGMRGSGSVYNMDERSHHMRGSGSVHPDDLHHHHHRGRERERDPYEQRDQYGRREPRAYIQPAPLPPPAIRLTQEQMASQSFYSKGGGGERSMSRHESASGGDFGRDPQRGRQQTRDLYGNLTSDGSVRRSRSKSRGRSSSPGGRSKKSVKYTKQDVRRVQEVANCDERSAINALIASGGHAQDAIDALYR
eukprot:gene21844-27915_t